MNRAYVITILTLSLFQTFDLRAEENPATWTQWRGPTRDGQVEGPSWPNSLKAEKLKQIWRVNLGPSYSGPIVSKDHVFVTETKDKKTEIVRALDRKTGKEIWKTEWQGSLTVPFFAAKNGSWIRSTPALDGDRLYVAGMRDLLLCLNAKNGAIVWKIDFAKETKSPVPAFGCVCSPLVDGDYLYIQAGASFAKVDKKNGKIIWRTLQSKGGIYDSAFSSPTIATLCDVRQLVVQTRTTLAGVDMESGKPLWEQKVPAFRGMNILTPVMVDDNVFTSTYGGKSFLFNVARNGKDFKVTEKWKSKAEGYMSTPVVIEGHAYLHLRNRRVSCIDLETGKQKWITGKGFGQYWSLVAQNDRILALDQLGKLHLLRANAEKFDLIDSRSVAEAETWAHLAVCGEELFVRELNALVVYRWK